MRPPIAAPPLRSVEVLSHANAHKGARVAVNQGVGYQELKTARMYAKPCAFLSTAV